MKGITMEEFIKFVEKYKKGKDFDETMACCFWFYMLKDFIIKCLRKVD